MRLYTLAVLSVFTEFPLSVTFSSRAITRSLNKRHRSKRSDGKGKRERKREGEREQKSARSWIDLIPPFLFSPSGYRFSDKLFGPPFSKRISLGNFQRRDTIDPFSTARFDSSTDGQLAGNSMDAREEEGSLSLFFIDFAKICRVEGARLVRNSARYKRPVPPCLLHPAKIETRERERIGWIESRLRVDPTSRFFSSCFG